MLGTVSQTMLYYLKQSTVSQSVYLCTYLWLSSAMWIIPTPQYIHVRPVLYLVQCRHVVNLLSKHNQQLTTEPCLCLIIT